MSKLHVQYKDMFMYVRLNTFQPKIVLLDYTTTDLVLN